MTASMPPTDNEADQAEATWRLVDLLPYLTIATFCGLLIGLVLLAQEGGLATTGQTWIAVAAILGLLAVLVTTCFVPPRLGGVEWVVLAVVTLIAAGIPLLFAESRSKADYVEVPIPASSFSAGTQGLAAGRPVELVALVPNKDKTPEPKYFSNVEITSFLGGAKDSAEPGSILVAVPTAQAQELHLALAADGTKLTYRLLISTPTPTVAITPTSTPAPTLTPTPNTANKVYVELDTSKINPSAASLITGTAQLIVVEKAPASGDTAEALIPSYITPQDPMCSDVVAFVDKNGKWQPGYNADTRQVLLQINQNDLAEYARRMAAAHTIWLVNAKPCPPEPR